MKVQCEYGLNELCISSLLVLCVDYGLCFRRWLVSLFASEQIHYLHRVLGETYKTEKHLTHQSSKKIVFT